MMDPENFLAWELMRLSVGEMTRHLAEPQLCDQVPSPAERAVIRRRVALALADPQVQEILYPKPERDEGSSE